MKNMPAKETINLWCPFTSSKCFGVRCMAWEPVDDERGRCLLIGESEDTTPQRIIF